MASYDTLVIGPISLDINIDYQDNIEREVGGAVVQSGWAAASSGAKTAILTKLNPKDASIDRVFADSGADLFCKPSTHTTSIRNQYFTADKERRACTALGQCDPFSFDDLPQIDSALYHFAGLMVGDFSGDLIRSTAAKGAVAVDVQALLRTVMPDGSMQFFDYKDKRDIFPFITYLKADAAEAETLTGQTDRFEAANALHSYGAKEIIISYNTEILAYDGAQFYTCPIKARSLVGRSGRGDTVFAAYITERLHADIPTALQYATALVSLKMETPGPFKGTRADVMEYIREFY
jgi:sugar/nucleoside kinase (ribokinase family)